MPINSFPIQTKNVTGLPPVISSSNTKLIVVSGTGAYLLDASSFVGGAAGVNMVNGLSGNLLLTGTGNITISNNSNTLIVSGNTGAYANFVTPSQTGFLTGEFVKRTETGGFGGGGGTVGVNSIGATGITNTGFFTGSILLSGAGNIVVSTGNNINKLIVVSGDTGAYSNFLTPSLTGNFITNGMTGALTGEFVRRSESGQFAASGNLTATGINLQGQLNTITTWTGTTPNIFSSITHGHNYITSLAATGTTNTGFFTGDAILSGAGNVVVSTGTPINKLIVVSGNTGAYANFVSLSQTGGLVSSANTGTFVTTGQTGLLINVFYPLNSNPSQYLTSSTVGGVRTLQTTGTFPSGIVSGNVVVSGTSIISVTTGNNGTIVISGNTGMFDNFTSDSELLSTSGYLVSLISASSAGVSSLNGLSGVINLIGSGNVAIFTGSQGITISGNTGAYSNFLTPGNIGGVRTLTLTGHTTQSGIISGDVVITGAGNVSVYTGISGTAIISGDTGAYANFVSLSQTGGLVSSANTGAFVTTGQTGTLTNVFYPLNSNPSGYITASSNIGVRMIVPTGTINSGQISGNVVITGAGNVSTYTGLSGLIIISGDTGAYSVFALKSDTGQFITTAQTGTFVTTGQTGLLTNVFYPLNTNPNGYLTNSTVGGVRMIVPTGTTNSGNISGNVIVTGAGNVSVFTGISGHIVVSGDTGAYTNFITPSQTGQFVTTAQTGGFLTLGNVGGVRMIVPTGTTRSGNISGNVIFTGAGNVTVETGISGHIVVSGNTGAYANFITPSQTGNVVNTSQTGGFASIQVTGSPLLSLVNLTGAGNVTVSTGSNPLVIVSGNTGAYANFITPSQTGLLTGAFYPLNSNPAGYLTSASAGVSSIRVTGNINTGFITGNVMFTGAGNVTVYTGISGLVVITGNTGAYANFITSSQTGLLTGQFYPLYQNPSGYVMGTTGTGILNGQLLIGASGINGFQQGDLYGLTGIIIVSGSGSLGVGIDASKVVTGLVAGTNISVSNNGTGLWTINATQAGSSGINSIITTGYFPSGTRSGIVYISGAGNVKVYTGDNNSIVVSGAGGGGVAAGVNTIGATGSTNTGYFTGDVLLSGAGTIVVSTGDTSKKLIVVSGGGNTIEHFYTVANFSGLHKLWIPAAAMTPSQITGASTGQIFTQNSGHTIDTLNFLSGSGQSAYFNLSFPKVWDKTNVVPVFYWTTTGNVGTINWGVAGANIDDGTSLNIQYNQGTTISDTTISGNYLHQTTGAPLSISGSLSDDDQCYFKVYRSAGGTLADEAKLIGVGIGYYETGLNATPSGGVNSITTTGVYPSGTVTGNIVLSGAGTISITTGISGTIIISGSTVAGPGGAAGVSSIAATGIINTGFHTGDVMFSGAGNIVVSTGTPLNKLIVVSGDTGTYSVFALKSETGQFITTAQTGIFVTTGQTGLLTNVFYPLNSNPSNYLTVSNEVGVRRIIPTGTINSGLISGNVILTGAGNVTTFTGISGHIVVSGNTGAYANFVTLSQTGNVVNTSQTGGFASIQVTGSPLLPLVNLTGAGNVTVVTGNNPLVIVSGNTGAYANFVSSSQTGEFLTVTSLSPYMLITGERNDIFAPLNIQFTVAKTGIIFTNTGAFRIYTVPSNLFFAPDSFELITKNVSGITTGAAFGVGSGTGFTSEFVSGYRMENTGTWGRGNFDMYTDIMTGGQQVKFNIYTGTTGATNTVHSGYFILRGTLYSGI